MIGALTASAVLLVTLWVNFVRPVLRHRRLRCPVDAYFHIRELDHGPVSYALQDDQAHSVRELVLPSNSVVDIEIAYVPKINFHVEETVFGIDGDEASKPLPLERHTKFIAAGKGKSHWSPGVDDSELIDYKGNYHFKPRTPKRSIGSCYTTGFKVKTQQAGTYNVWLGFLTDEFDGNVKLKIIVEDKPHTRMRCINHGYGCNVRPLTLYRG